MAWQLPQTERSLQLVLAGAVIAFTIGWRLRKLSFVSSLVQTAYAILGGGFPSEVAHGPGMHPIEGGDAPEDVDEIINDLPPSESSDEEQPMVAFAVVVYPGCGPTGT